MADTETPESSLVDGRYRLHRVLGRGGMGIVWAARDEILGREVAVKEVRPQADLSPEKREELRERTMREARNAARLTHPSVVRVYDVVEDEGRPWIVMELLDPRTLADIIAADGAMAPRAAARIGLELLDALRTAHRAGVLHRDVKPGNVMLSSTGRAVLTDFGIARAEDDPTLTQTGLIVGSPGYMSPERARGERPTAASDLWALGATLYAMVEGDPPFLRDGQLQTLHAVISEPLPPPIGAGPLRPLIESLLDKDPDRRPTADEALDLLRRILDAPGPGPAATPSLDPAQAPTRLDQTAVAAAGEGARAPARAPSSAAASAARPSSPAPPSTGATRRGPLVAVGALVVLALVAVAIVFLRPFAGGDPLPVSAPSATSPTGSPATTGAGSAPSPSGAATPSDTAAGPRTTRLTPPAGGTSPGDGVLPGGWSLQTDPSGFAVAVPAGWSRSVRNGSTYFREPDGRAFLQIAQTSQPKSDVLADWQSQASTAAGRFAGYRQVRIERVDYRGWDTADWEFTWQASGGLLHVINRNVRVSDQRAYALYWSVPEQDWQRRLADFETITNTFRPAT